MSSRLVRFPLTMPSSLTFALLPKRVRKARPSSRPSTSPASRASSAPPASPLIDPFSGGDAAVPNKPARGRPFSLPPPPPSAFIPGVHEPFAVMPASPASPASPAPASAPEAATGPRPDYDATAAYDALLDAVSQRSRKRARPRKGLGPDTGMAADPYQRLMAQEGRVLDTVDRVVNERARAATQATSILSMSIAQHGARFVGVLRGLLDDLTAAQDAQAVARAFWQEDRRLYLGVALVAIALLALLVDQV